MANNNAIFSTPADVYLKAGETLQLQGLDGLNMAVGVQLTLVQAG